MSLYLLAPSNSVFYQGSKTRRFSTGHPKNLQTFITSSADSTIRYILTLLEFSQFIDRQMDRIWDLEDKQKQKSVIVIKSKERGARTRVNACAYSQDGNMIGGGEPFSVVAVEQ